jgi:hypothetical protein
MKARILIVIAAPLILGVGLAIGFPEGLAAVSSKFTPRSWSSDDSAQTENGDAKAGDEVEIWKRIVLKDNTIRDLVQERITLEQAAARFVEVNSNNQHYYAALDVTYGGIDRSEAVYRNVLDYAAAMYERFPNFSAIQQRLEMEFQQCREKQFPLPPIPQRTSAVSA